MQKHKASGRAEVFVLLRLIAEQNTRTGYDNDGSMTYADAERITNEYLRLSQTVETNAPPIGRAWRGGLSAFRDHLRHAAPLLSRLTRRS